ncbi:hypothetical protein G6M26_23590 [Agrobacterium tumefaciens]|nr:hypothetical protein [Agrobacterium tumefaciens]NTE21527.1 hypothetical protein [Agrobacterium tumefaciens]
MNPFSSNEKYILIIYRKIRGQIPSINEMVAWSPDRRPDDEVRLIFSVISKFIYIDKRQSEVIIYLINPRNNEPGILLKMIKSGVNYTIDEFKPFILKSFGSIGFSVGAEISVKMEWAKYLNKLNNRPDKLMRTASYIQQGTTLSKFSKVSGKIFKKSGVLLDLIGTSLIYYDILSAGSPSIIDSDKIIQSTIDEISKLCQKSRPYNL